MTSTIQIRKRTAIGKRVAMLSICTDVLVLLLGLTSSLIVHLVGDLPVSEMLLIPLLPILVVVRPNRVVRPALRPFFLLMGLWLAGEVASDIYHSSAVQDWMRGDARIVFFALNLACFALLLGRSARRRVLFIVGLAVSSLFSARFQPSDLSLDHPWKFGYAGGVTLIVLLIASLFFRLRWYPAVVVLMAGIMGIHLIENYRSPVLLLLVTLVLAVPLIPERLGQLRILPPAGSGLRVVVLAAMAIAAGGAAEGIVHFATTAGLLGDEAQKKNEVQSQVKGGILVGARPEILVSSRAVLESPILGHGSWAKDYRYTEMLTDLIVENGGKGNLEEEIEHIGGLIPTHSHLMGAWVEAGVLGAVFWMYALWMAVRAVIRVAILRPPLAPLYVFMLIGWFWAILFSPFSTTLRAMEAFLIVLVADVLESGPSVLKASRRKPWQQWRRMGADAYCVRPNSVRLLPRA